MATGILVSYSGFPYTPSSFFPDNGLAALAGVLKAAGHDVRIVDTSSLKTFERFVPPDLRREMAGLVRHFFEPPNDPEVLARFARAEQRIHDEQRRVVEETSRELLALVDSLGADWVGFKLYLGDGFEGSVAMAEFLRSARPRLKLFAGGPQVDLFKEHNFQRTTAFDALVYAEGENVMAPLMEYVEGKRSLASVPNCVFRDTDGKVKRTALERVPDLDALALPAYDAATYPALAADGKIRVITFDESRGCPYGCAFCIHAEKSGKRMRVKSVPRMLEELQALRAAADTRVFRFAGSATPFKVLANLGEELLKSGLDIMYSIYGTPHHLDTSLLPRLRESGLWAVFFGVESGDPKILEASMGKRNNHPEKMEAVLRATLDAGIFTVASILYPAPHETDESTERTLRFLTSIFKGRDHCSIPVSFAGLFPTTTWLAERERFGFEIESYDSYMLRAMNYKIKSLLPYWLWDEVPYTLNGKSGRELQRQSSTMIRRLEAEGITTMLLDDSAMIGTLAGYPLKEYRRDVAAAFFTGNVDYVGRLVDKVNDAVRPAA